MTDIIIGLNASQTRAAADGPEFKVGTCASASDPITSAVRDYVYCFSAAGTAAGGACAIDENTQAVQLTTTNAAAGTYDGTRIGVAVAAIPAGGWGWVQIYGPCLLSVAASCVKYTRLFTTAGAGVLDDAATASRINGLVLTATATTAGVYAAFANYPVVSLAA